MDDSSRRVEELRGDIEETREEMSDTLGAIQEKLRPSHIVAQATDRVKQATIEGVRDMTESATETARGAMSNRAIPLAMIGLGAAWLWMERSSGSSTGSRSAWSDNDAGRYRYQWEREEAARWRNTSAGHQYSHAEDDFGGTESVTIPRQRPGGAGARRGMSFDAGMDRLERTARRTQSRVQRMVRNSPILVGAGALMLGAAFGMAVPETDVENEWMGEARDSVIDRAQQMAQDAATKIQDTAGSLADAAGRIVAGGGASEG